MSIKDVGPHTNMNLKGGKAGGKKELINTGAENWSDLSKIIRGNYSQMSHNTVFCHKNRKKPVRNETLYNKF